VSVTSSARDTHRSVSDSSHKLCVSTSATFSTEPNLYLRRLHRTNLHSTNIQHQLHTRSLSPVHLLLLLILRKHLICYGEIGCCTSLHFTSPCLHYRFDRPILPSERVLFSCFPFVTYCVPRKETDDSSVSCLCQ
jgi:hypothetical protein